MDLIHYAKWGIHVKEEPDSVDTLQFKEAEESNVAEINGGWMCKFPCDAQAAFNVSIAGSIPSGLQEPIEASLPSYSVDYPESVGFHPPAVSTLPGGTESVNVDCVSQLYSILQQDEPAKMFTSVTENTNKNYFVKSPPECQSLSNTDRQQLIDSDNAVILDDLPQRGVICPDFGNIEENIHLLNNKISDGCDETASDLGRPEELLQNSSFKHIDNVCHEIDSDENNENDEASCSSPEELSNVPDGICSLNNNVTKTNHQKNCLKEKSARNSENSGFKCPDCNKVIRRSSGFLTHMKLHHMTTMQSEPVPVKCKHCTEAFLSRKSLFLHKKVCKYSKKNSFNSFYDNQDDKVLTSTKCMDKGVQESSLLYTILKSDKKEPSNSEGNIQEISENRLHQNPETNHKSSGKPQKTRSSISGSNSSNSNSSLRRRKSSEKESEPTSKKKRLSQSFEDFCPEIVGVHDSEKNNNVREKWSELKNRDYQDSWFSEIKCKEDEERHPSKSIILSLRRFRFRKPKVLVTRAEIPISDKKVSETKSVDSVEVACSLSANNMKSQFQEERVYNSINKEHSPEHVTSEVETTSECLKKIESDLTLARDTGPASLLVNHEFSQENSRFVTCSKSLDNGKKCYSKPNPSNILNKQCPNVEDIQKAVSIPHIESQTVRNLSPVSVGSNSFLKKLAEKDCTVDVLHDNESSKNSSKFLTEQKSHSNLKIRIKPVVVLNRIGLFENINKESYTSEVTSKKYIKKTLTPKKACDQITVNVDSKESNNSESFLFSGFDSNNKSALRVKSAFHAQNSDNEDFAGVKNKLVSENKGSSFTKKLISNNSTCSLDKSKNESQYDSKVETLEKQYCLKKCYVKLQRIQVEDNDTVKCDKSFNKNPRADGELRTCEKLKLHRTDSKSWEISSVKSCHFQNIIPVDNSPSSDLKELTKENNIMKKCPTSEASSRILRESSGVSHKNHRLALKGRHVKHFRTQCTWCGKPFFNQQEYAEHLKTHFEEYKCHKCSAKFHLRTELQNHLVGCSLASFLHCQNDIPIKECQVILGKVRNK